jgi:CHAT domain-containing protein
VPFHALWNGRTYLIDNHTISYAPSATVLYHTLTAKKQRQTCAPLILGLADETIPFATEEAQAISLLFPQADVRLQEKATLPAEPTWDALPAFVHLSTHATFRADNPLFSAIKLHDRWLSVNDMYGLDAPVPLVTLSACETGQNQVLVGDELLGLCRGFFAAGVHSLVVSLWRVDDYSTTELMTKFYQGLQARLTVNQAMRAAQLAIKSVADEGFDHPYYWAPFIVTGNMQTQIDTNHFH